MAWYNSHTIKLHFYISLHLFYYIFTVQVCVFFKVFFFLLQIQNQISVRKELLH